MKLFKDRAIIAHRGARGLVPFENTIEAFQKAIDCGSDGIELDIRKTKDGIIVVHHNADYNGALLKDLTYQELIEKTQKDGFTVPTLEETLMFCKKKIFLDIEFKEAGYEKEAIDLILKYLSYDEFYVRSFKKKVLRTIKLYNKNVKTVLLVGVIKGKYFIVSRLSEFFPLFLIMYTKCDILSPSRYIYKFFYKQRMHLLGRPVIVWTVNKEEEMNKLLNVKKIDAIITDYPDKAIRIKK